MKANIKYTIFLVNLFNIYVILLKSINLNYMVYITVTQRTTIAERINGSWPTWL